MINIVLASICLLGIMAVLITLYDEDALLHLAARSDARRMYLQNIRAEQRRWREYSEDRCQRFIAERVAQPDEQTGKGRAPLDA